MPKGRHGENVRDEVPRQEANKNETRRNFSAQRKDNAFGSQYRSKLYSGIRYPKNTVVAILNFTVYCDLFVFLYSCLRSDGTQMLSVVAKKLKIDAMKLMVFQF